MLTMPEALTACRYDLHVLMVGHGKRCARCAANGRPRFEPDGPCPLFPAKGSPSKCAQTRGKPVVAMRGAGAHVLSSCRIRPWSATHSNRLSWRQF